MRRRTKEKIGASAPEPCAGCGQKIIGEGWDIVHYLWKGKYIPKVRHAFSPACNRLIDERYEQALADEREAA